MFLIQPSLRVACTFVALAWAPSAGAQRGQAPPAHPLGAVVATSEPFRTVTQVVTLSDGRLLVHDAAAKRVVLIDTGFARGVPVIDSTAGTSNSYGAGGTLLRFRGDSALFLERSANSFLVLDPTGKIARVMAGPQGSGRGGPGVPGALQTVYAPSIGVVYAQRQPPVEVMPATPTNIPPPGAADFITTWDDSSLVIAFDMTTRKTDTVFKIASGNTARRTIPAGGRGGGGGTSTARFPFYDDMVVMSDGSLTVFRARDYRLEWYAGDRTRTISPRIPYPWVRMTDDGKKAYVDSANAANRKLFDDAMAKRAADSAAGKPAVMRMTTVIDGTPITREMPAPPIQPPPPIQITEVPDFLPPTTRGAVFADADNRVWIRPKISGDTVSGHDVYDVVDRKGIVVDRVRVPSGRTIAGFMPGFVLLVARDAGTLTLQKVRLR